MAQPTLGGTAEAIGVQGGRRAHGHEEAIEVEAVIWIGITAMIVIAAVIAAIGRPGRGPGGSRRSRNAGSRTRTYSRVGTYSGTAGYSGGYDASSWSGDSCSGGFSGGDSGGSCGGGGGGF